MPDSNQPQSQQSRPANRRPGPRQPKQPGQPRKYGAIGNAKLKAQLDELDASRTERPSLQQKRNNLSSPDRQSRPVSKPRRNVNYNTLHFSKPASTIPAEGNTSQESGNPDRPQTPAPIKVPQTQSQPLLTTTMQSTATNKAQNKKKTSIKDKLYDFHRRQQLRRKNQGTINGAALNILSKTALEIAIKMEPKANSNEQTKKNFLANLTKGTTQIKDKVTNKINPK